MVKEGYTQTEVGEIPEDWGLSTIGRHTSWLSGGTPSRSIGEYWSGNVPWISGSTLKTVEISNSDQCLTEEAVNKGSKMAPLGSTLLLVRGSALHNEIRAGVVIKPVCFNQDVKALVPDKALDSKYLTFSILGNHHKILKLVSSAGNSAGVLDTKLVQDFPLLLPPKDEQKKITKALSDVDELIISLEKLITKKRDIKTAMMQQLLTGKKRLPGFGEGKGYKQTELGEIPEDWILQQIGDSFEFKNGLNKEKKYFGYGTPIINYMDVYSHSGLNVEDVLGKVDVTAEERQAYGAKKGDVFFTRTSETVDEIGVACTLLEDIKDAVFSGFILRARPKDHFFDLSFQRYCFGSTLVRKQIMSTSSYTTRALTNGRLLSEVKIPAPINRKEQGAIAKILTDMQIAIDNQEAILAKTKAIKQGMMQELLTGRARLVDVGEVEQKQQKHGT